MNNKKNTDQSIRIWASVYLLTTVVFIIGFFLGNEANTLIFWSVAIIGWILNSLVFPLGRKNRPALSLAGVGFMVAALAMGADLFDEITGNYKGGFGAGNGFLYDGLGVITYYVIGPMFILAGASLLLTNSIQKYRKRERSNELSIKLEVLPVLSVVSVVISIVVIIVVFSWWKPTPRDFGLFVVYSSLFISGVSTAISKRGPRLVSIVCLAFNIIMLTMLYIVSIFRPPSW